MALRWGWALAATLCAGCAEQAATPPAASVPPPDPVHEQLAAQAAERDHERAQAEQAFADQQAQRVADRDRALEQDHVDAEKRRQERLQACAAGQADRDALFAAAEARRAELARYCHARPTRGTSDRVAVQGHLDGTVSVGAAVESTVALPACDPGTPREVMVAAMTRHPEVERARVEQRVCDDVAAGRLQP